MKNYITPSYVFTPGAANAGTIQIIVAGFDIKRLAAVINVTRNVIIYAPGLSGTGLFSSTGNTITLQFDTSTQNANDSLQILYDMGSNIELVEAIEAMRMAIVSLQKSIGMAQVNPLTGRMLVDPSGVTSPISGSVTVSGSVTANQGGTWNQTQIGGQSASSVVTSFERGTADNLRRNINVT